MDNLPENVRKAFETYLKGNKKEALEMLIPGSQYRMYLTIVDAFKSNKGKITEKLKEMIEKFKKNYPSLESRRVELQSYLLQYDQFDKEEDKDKVITQIDKNFVFGFYDYSKPAEIKGIKEKSKTIGKTIKKKKTNNVFNQGVYFSEADTINKMFKTSFKLYNLNRSLLNKVDYMKVNDSAFEEFLNVCQHFSDLTIKSFMKRFIDFIKKKYSKDKHYILSNIWLDKMTEGKSLP